jgi:hypothetical protein
MLKTPALSEEQRKIYMEKKIYTRIVDGIVYRAEAETAEEANDLLNRQIKPKQEDKPPRVEIKEEENINNSNE